MGNAPGEHQVCVQTTDVVCRTPSDSEPRYGIVAAMTIVGCGLRRAGTCQATVTVERDKGFGVHDVFLTAGQHARLIRSSASRCACYLAGVLSDVGTEGRLIMAYGADSGAEGKYPVFALRAVLFSLPAEVAPATLPAQYRRFNIEHPLFRGANHRITVVFIQLRYLRCSIIATVSERSFFPHLRQVNKCLYAG